MQNNKSPVTGWKLGCVITVLLSITILIIWFFWEAITGNWIARSICIGASLLYLFILARRKRSKKLKTARHLAESTQNARLAEIENFRRIIASPSTVPSFASDVLYLQRYFSDEEVAMMIANGRAINGNSGGLILGRSHSRGGIPVLMSLPGGGYELKAEFEGYEYLLNPGVLVLYHKECESMNQYVLDKHPGFTEYTPEVEITLLDVRASNHPAATKYLILDGSTSFFIVNRYSTKLRLEPLERLNSSVTYEQWLLAKSQLLQAKKDQN